MTPDLTISYFLLALSTLSLGLLTAFHKNKSVARTSFSVLAFSQFFWICSLFLGYHFTTVDTNLKISETAIRFAYFFGSLLTPSLIYFLHDFSVLKTRPNFLNSILLFPFTIVLGFVTIFTPLIHSSSIISNQTYLGDNFGVLYPFYIILVTYHIIYGLFLSVKKLIKSKDLEFRRFTIITSATWFFLLPTFIINVILPNFEIYLLPFHSVVLSMFFTVPTYFTILKYRFFSPTYITIKCANFFILLSVFILFLKTFQVSNQDSINIILAFSSTILINRYLPKFENKNLQKFQSIILNLQFQIEHIKHPKHLKQLLTESLNLKLGLPQPKIVIIHNPKHSIDFQTINKKPKHQKLKNVIYLDHEIPKIAKDLHSSVILPLAIDNEIVAFLC